MNVPIPSDRSAYSDPSFVKGVSNTLFLLANHKRLAEIGQSKLPSGAWPIFTRYNVF